MKYQGFVNTMEQTQNWFECKKFFSARISDQLFDWCEAQESAGSFATVATPGSATHRFWFERKDDYLLFVLRWGEK